MYCSAVEMQLRDKSRQLVGTNAEYAGLKPPKVKQKKKLPPVTSHADLPAGTAKGDKSSAAAAGPPPGFGSSKAAKGDGDNRPPSRGGKQQGNYVFDFR